MMYVPEPENNEKDWVTAWNELRQELEDEQDLTIVLDKFFAFWTQHNAQIQKEFNDLWQGIVDTLVVVIQQVDPAVSVYERLAKDKE